MPLDTTRCVRSRDVSTVDRHGRRSRTASACQFRSTTLVAQETADDLPAIYELLKTFPVMRLSLFFLISVGRGTA